MYAPVLSFSRLLKTKKYAFELQMCMKAFFLTCPAAIQRPVLGYVCSYVLFELSLVYATLAVYMFLCFSCMFSFFAKRKARAMLADPLPKVKRAYHNQYKDVTVRRESRRPAPESDSDMTLHVFFDVLIIFIYLHSCLITP